MSAQPVGLLAAGLAHDLNNMLGGILATAELVASRAKAPADRADLAAIIGEAAKASGLVRQLLAFTRQAALRPEPLTLAGLVEAQRPTLAACVGEGLELDIRLHEAAPARADRVAIERVLLNLVLNARAAAQGRIRIETAVAGPEDVPVDARAFMPLGAYAVLAVADDGPGVAPDILPRLFQPFVTGRPDGQGLGLASAFGLVKQSGGFLLHDQGPWGGARFRLFLPLRDVAADMASAPVLPPLPRRRPAVTAPGQLPGILLVEDEPLLRDSLARHLRRRGHRVADVPDAGAALAVHAEQQGLDLLLSDVRLPGMDGPALAQCLRARVPGLPVLFMTGHATASARRALEASADAVLVKPFTLAELEGALGRVTAGA